MSTIAEKITTLNPQVLKWARINSGASMEEAGKKAGKSEYIVLWENGEDYPTYTQLKNLSTLYRKPIAIFFFPEPPELKNIKTSFRTLPENIYDNLSRQSIKIIDESRVMQLNLLELNNGVNPSLSKITKYEFNINDSKNVAIELRDFMGVNLQTQKKIKKLEDAFEFWRDCFYEIGINVFKFAFKDNNVSGFCFYDQEFPVICINNSLAPARQIFTLFHEIYHIICSTSGVDFIKDDFLNTYDNKSNYMIERSCNRFAGEFLVPDDDFDVLIKKLIPSEETISKLANIYCVSREVILRKFLDRNKVTQDEYEEKRAIYNQDYLRNSEKKKQDGKAGGGDYYNNQSIYKGKHYIKLVFETYYAKNISVNQLSHYMNMTIPSVKELAARKGWGII